MHQITTKYNDDDKRRICELVEGAEPRKEFYFVREEMMV
jgi:hypothetical protein